MYLKLNCSKMSYITSIINCQWRRPLPICLVGGAEAAAIVSAAARAIAAAARAAREERREFYEEQFCSRRSKHPGVRALELPLAMPTYSYYAVCHLMNSKDFTICPYSIFFQRIPKISKDLLVRRSVKPVKAPRGAGRLTSSAGDVHFLEH